MKTVKEVSSLSGVSIRTLRYYDEIGLFKPTMVSEVGYRLYDNNALMRLQEIMLFKEFEMPLSEIKEIMKQQDYAKQKVFLIQKELLEQKRNKLNGIITLIDDLLKGENSMNFEVFSDRDTKEIISNLKMKTTSDEFADYISMANCDNEEQYQQRLAETLADENTNINLIKWYGSKEKAINATVSNTIRTIEYIQEENTRIHQQLAKLMVKGNQTETINLIQKLEDCYKDMFKLDNARAFLLDMAKEYIENETLRITNDEQYGVGSSEYIGRAILDYYGYK